MAMNSQHAFNAADVADAVFTGMMLRHEQIAETEPTCSQENLHALLSAIDTDLKMAGLTFAEYLERLRQIRHSTSCATGKVWRFSARERAVQRVDNSVAHLCALMQPVTLNS